MERARFSSHLRPFVGAIFADGWLLPLQYVFFFNVSHKYNIRNIVILPRIPALPPALAVF